MIWLLEVSECDIKRGRRHGMSALGHKRTSLSAKGATNKCDELPSRLLWRALAEHPASDQPRNNVSNSTKVKRWRCLTCTSSTKRSCDEVNQNLFHVNLPMSTNVFVVTGATLRRRTALSLLPSCCGFFQQSKYFAGVAIKPQTAKPSAVRSQWLCLRPPTCRVLGQHSLGVETG